jgi:hypothetical protein
MPSSQQLTAAQNISRVFAAKKLRYAILKSQCQSGKTGTYQALISLLLREGQIDRAYVLCGSNELELRSQAIEDTKTHNAEAWARGEIVVLFRQDFASASMNVERALIVVDESHMDTSKGQQLDQFLARHGLTMDGNPATLAEKKAFILSVDATPYAELAALAHGETPYEKHVEELATGESYIGIAHYLYRGLLHPTFDIAKKNYFRFAALFNGVEKKYALLRLPAGRKGVSNSQEAAVKKVCRVLKSKVRVLYYTAAQTDIAITRSEQTQLLAEGRSVPCLEDKPEMNTLVIIRGRLRAGKVVPKKHISFVWEGAEESKTDSLVQGLLGRMCGYPQAADAAEDPTKLNPDALPVLFAPPSALERREKKVVKSSEIERAILAPDVLPTKATNLKKAHIATEAVRAGEKMTQLTPLRITLPEAKKLSGGDEDEGDYGRLLSAAKASDTELGIVGRSILLKNLRLIDGLPCSQEQKDEIQRFVSTAKPHVRRFQKNEKTGEWTQLSYFKELAKAYENDTTPAENIDGCPEMTFCVTYPGYNGARPGASQERHLYVVFYTRASSGPAWVKNSHLLSRIAQTNGRSIFSLSKRATAVPLVAAGATGFCEANLKSPESFEAALRAYMAHWKTSELTVSREIASVSERFSLEKKAFHYTDAKNNDVLRVCEKVGKEFSVKMEAKFARSTAGANGHFNLKTISW